MFLRLWTLMHSFCFSVQDIHRCVENKVFITAFCGARSTVDGKNTLQGCNALVSPSQLCFITVSQHVDIPGGVSVLFWGNASSGYHLVRHLFFPPSTGEFYCQ